MNKINRNSFIKMGALAALAPLGNKLLAQTGNKGNDFLIDDTMLKRLVAANDKQVESLFKSIIADKFIFSRRASYEFAALSSAFCSPGSSYYQSPLVKEKLDIIVKGLAIAQSPDGTINTTNLESPPDTGFVLELLTAGAAILLKNNSPELNNIKENVKSFIQKAGNALVTGGVHTPNHRWVICAALSKINALYPDKKYINRINEWLGEGIFNDSDGQYPERSRNYSDVENNSMITMARLLNKPALFEPVRKNLDSNYYYMEPNGDLVTTDSRRQDQWGSKSMTAYYLHYRYLAIRDNNSKFAGIARLIEQLSGFENEVVSRSLHQFLENSLLQQEMPIGITPPVIYEKFLTTSQLLRIRRNAATTTLFGGVDWPIIIASGRSGSPNFYSYRNGKAILKYIRLSSAFFSMGYFYSQGIKKDGNKYILHKKLEVPYYQPLPVNKRNAKGDYKLSPSIDDRFWNKMDFSNRPVSNVKTLDTTVTFSETNNGNELLFNITGFKGVFVAIELCFQEGGKLSGVVEGENGNSFLEQGIGKYELGNDTLQFGPGANAHHSVENLEGEKYSTHFGSLRTKGMFVYITGVTPFQHKLVFK
ncbi:MAG: hypothetical protein ABIR18_05665 [Chitinophagaceae bacterium]